MIRLFVNYLLLGLSFFMTSVIVAQDLKVPVASPTQTLTQNFGLSTIGIEYSRPSVKGRVIFGDLVPFGKIWRTGANASTKITFGEDVKVEGVSIKAGTYALYTIPNRDFWDIIFYKDLTLGGRTTELKSIDELARIKVKPMATLASVETFTINLANMNPTRTEVELTWEKTRVAFQVTVDVDEKIMASIDKSLANDTRPYYQAANYYYENNKDLNKALTWVYKAVEQNPKAYWVVFLKAKIEYKLSDKNAAITTCEKVISLATEAKNDEFIKLANDLIAQAKK